jgi:hypothetical protein
MGPLVKFFTNLIRQEEGSANRPEVDRNVVDKDGMTRVSWAKAIAGWSRGKLKPIKLAPAEGRALITDTLREFDGAEVESGFRRREGWYYIEVAPTFRGEVLDISMSADISYKDGKYRHIGSTNDATDSSTPDGAVDFNMSTFAERYAGRKTPPVNLSDRGNQVAAEKFDALLAVIAKQINISRGGRG